MKTLSFSKYSGAGNTFLITTAKDWQNANLEKRHIQEMCSPIKGLAADGVLILHPSSEADFKWEFYNSDGSTAEMCGNLARCASLWSLEALKKQKTSFLTTAGLVVGQHIHGDQFKITMTSIQNLDLYIEDNPVYDSGVPHLIRFLPQLSLLKSDLASLRSDSARLRKHSSLGVAGANVTYVCEKDETHIQAVTYERGVEDFTLACGTGAVAAAYHQHLRTGKKIIEVEMPGGLLQVDLEEEQPKLTGSAIKVATGEWIVR